MPFRNPSARAVTPGRKGRFPGFDVLEEVDRWDDVTAGVVLARLDPQPEVSFFTVTEQATADALFDQLLGQDREPKVPVLLLVDRRLALGQTDGWRYEDMPEDGQAWRQTLAALDDEARSRHDERFHRLSWEQQGTLVQAVHDADTWHGLPAARVWSLWTRYTSTAFYSHPWAWNEIGFGGPAYPRGYKALGINKREGWEVADHHNADPVSFAERVERAKRCHARTNGSEHHAT
jgi:Gluconate 2-dehydrogenase subunit 3